MDSTIRRSIFIFFVAHCLHDVSAWSGPPTPRRSMIRDQLLLPIIGATIGATQCAPPRMAVAAETTSPAAIAVEAQLSSSSAAAALSSGVLWRTARGDALPATPSSLAQIMKDEFLGPVSAAASSGIVCISERHDDMEHHKIQLKVLMTMKKVLTERSQDVSEKLSVGMEMFQRRHQIYLDRYVAKPQEYSLADLMRDTKWNSTWGYDILHYLPLLLFAQKFRIRILGLHPSEEEVEFVKLHGLNANNGSSSPPIIGGVRTDDREHAEDFRRVTALQMSLSDFGGCVEAMEAAIARQYEVQCFREEYMAETAAIQMASQPDGWIALLAGERHILKRNGLPFRALRRSTNIRMKGFLSLPSLNRGLFTIVPRTEPFPAAAKDAIGMESADYVWYVQRDPSTEFREHEVNAAPMRKMDRRA
mmetsp:Transcript_6398/g.13842  ORF Transcript_6398/g.13842 Transcript_6398/m.13842 type:complete len:419 (+) Transcript_6398:76-1332(+)